MKLINRLTVGIKIVAVVAIGLLALFYVSLTSILRLRDVNKIVYSLTEELAVEQSYADDIHANIHEIETDIDQYIAFADDTNRYHFDEVASNIQNGLKNIQNISTSEKRIGMANEIDAELTRLTATFDEIAVIIQDRESILDKTLQTAVKTGNETIEPLCTQASALEAPSAASTCDELAAEFTAMQLITYKFVDSQHNALIAEFQTHYEAAGTALADINSMLAGGTATTLIADLQSSLDTYNEGFQALVEAYQQQAMLIDESITPSQQVLLDSTEALADAVKQEFETTATASAKLVKNTELIIPIISVIAVLFSLFIGYFLIRGIVRPLREVENVSTIISNNHLQKLMDEMHLLAKGDLTRTLAFSTPEINIRNTDEIGRMAKSFNKIIAQLHAISEAFVNMSENLSGMVGSVHLYAETIQQSAEDLAGTSNHAGEATSQISVTLQQVAEGISQQTESVSITAISVENLTKSITGVSEGVLKQAHSISEVNQLTQNMSQSIQQVSKNIRSVTTNAAKAAEKSKEGSSHVSETINDMEMIYNTVQSSSLKVKEMGDHSNQIEIILETIEDIASQTNLLALNAAIEAARAGEHGKGFAVVADEVRKLAERSGKATKEIEELIKQIQNSVHESIAAMETTSKQVDKGVNTVSNTGFVFQSILDAIRTVNTESAQVDQATTQMLDAANQMVEAVQSVSAIIEENSAASDEMTENAERLTNAIDNIASVSEENSAAVEEVSSSTEEITAQAEEVADSSSALKMLADNLFEVVSTFKINADDEFSMDEDSQ